ncbi:hypothetical protein AB0C06_00270 [Micromonospora inaquosa]|uniref:hypothetical protein n=1 Tax=Micromonospora inaquosa TaxID=2203716 RepID=UPI0034031344
MAGWSEPPWQAKNQAAVHTWYPPEISRQRRARHRPADGWPGVRVVSRAAGLVVALLG